MFVKFSTLQEYGVDKIFFLENDNIDTSQRNVIFLARGEKASQPIAIAGMFPLVTHVLQIEIPSLPLCFILLNLYVGLQHGIIK